MAGALLLARCSSGGLSREEIARLAAAYDPKLECGDTFGLWPAEVKTREDNEYTNRSTSETEYCFTCNNWEAPARPDTCGTCKTVKGPINPLGHCTARTAARS